MAQIGGHVDVRAGRADRVEEAVSGTAAHGDAADALAKTASSVFDLLEATYKADAPELLLVESQEFYANPRMQFEVTRVR